MKVVKQTVDTYLRNSHLSYNENFVFYCEIQVRYPDVLSFDKALHALLPKILDALPNDAEKLKECSLSEHASHDISGVANCSPD